MRATWLLDFQSMDGDVLAGSSSGHRISSLFSGIRICFPGLGRSRSRSRISEQHIYGPRNLVDDKLVSKREDSHKIRSELVAKIQSCYGWVDLRGVFDAGFCFGLLDPVSNIVAGTVIARVVKVDPRPKASFPRQKKPDLIGDMNQRSLNGLVAFLVALFPFLTNAKAMWYLNKAELDPLVAACLIIKHRRMEWSYEFASNTTVAAVERALICAAAAAQHPNPQQFALGWKLLSPCVKKVATVLSAPYATSDPFECVRIAEMLLEQSQSSTAFILQESWDLATSRLVKLKPDLFSYQIGGKKGKVFPERLTVRRMLLTTIHGYYLQALARLPNDKLRSDYHHSLLQAGHCYGPLDPVSNIILNTIWYSRAYPLTKKVEIEAISTRGLLRIAVQSFYSLVSFLCTRCVALTPDEAMQRLQAAGANLLIADPNLLDDDKNNDAMVSASVEEAYAAAAAAALHPVPYHQVSLLRPSNPMLLMASDYLKDGGKLLSHKDADQLSNSLFYSCLTIKSEQQQAETDVKMLNKWEYLNVEAAINNFWNQHARAISMVKSAMDVYSQRHGVPTYELHVICGVNECVDGPVYTTSSTGTYHCSHINFLATQSAGKPPTLFFAECRNDGTEVGLCCPVSVPPPGTEQVRCLYCEFRGSGIVHPAREGFHGHDIEYEKMLGGEGLYVGWYTNDGIIKSINSYLATNSVGDLDDDCIYDVYHVDDKNEGFKYSDMVRYTIF